jgi:hypothetical protein
MVIEVLQWKKLNGYEIYIQNYFQENTNPIYRTYEEKLFENSTVFSNNSEE